MIRRINNGETGSSFRASGKRGTGRKTENVRVQRMIVSLMLALAVLAGGAGRAFANGSWICPACGHGNPERAKFCGSCRQPAANAEIPAAAETNAWVCSGCGEICPDADSFCMICGSDRHASDSRALLMPEPEEKSVTLPSAEIRYFEDTFSEKTKSASYEFTAQVTGSYYVFLKQARKGFRLRASVLNAQGDCLASDFLSRGSGYTVWLTAGSHYSVLVNQYENLGEFRLGLGIPKKWEDLGDGTEISDSFSHLNQDNRYTITPRTSGIYTFRLGRAMKGFRMKLSVNDEQGYSLKSDFLKRNGAISLRLNAGTTYYLHASQYEDLGDYQLNIGRPRKTMDITGCLLIGGRVFYLNEQNLYTFTAPKDGEYQFRFSRADSGFRTFLDVNDSGGYSLGSEYVRQGGKVSVKLRAGSTYTVRAVQYEGYGTYNLQISY